MDELYPLHVINTGSISPMNACISILCLLGILAFIQHLLVNEPNRARKLYRKTNFPVNI